MNLEEKSLEELFKLADKIGKKPYHRLTAQDFEDYKRFDNWRCINVSIEYVTTKESKDWVWKNSHGNCPICKARFSECGGPTIDHKLPRAQYPWLSMEFKNLWVICLACNQEKGEKHWFEYEHYILIHHPELLDAIRLARPTQLLKTLKQ
jgi:5-methylcytosine-specific restriction endonuclease McrA